MNDVFWWLIIAILLIAGWLFALFFATLPGNVEFVPLPIDAVYIFTDGFPSFTER
jgi:hypothetical protein